MPAEGSPTPFFDVWPPHQNDEFRRVDHKNDGYDQSAGAGSHDGYHSFRATRIGIEPVAASDVRTHRGPAGKRGLEPLPDNGPLAHNDHDEYPRRQIRDDYAYLSSWS